MFCEADESRYFIFLSKDFIYYVISKKSVLTYLFFINISLDS